MMQIIIVGGVVVVVVVMAFSIGSLYVAGCFDELGQRLKAPRDLLRDLIVHADSTFFGVKYIFLKCSCIY